MDLFDTKYRKFTARHFELTEKHDFKRSYNWVRVTLQAHGKIKPAPRRGVHRRKRPRRPMIGMMLHQDGSTHQWVPNQYWDLIVTMDDASSEIYSAFFVAEEGTMSCFQALLDVASAKGMFCSLYADRASHYWHTSEAGGKVDKDNPTQDTAARIELIRPIRPRPGAARSACSGLQNRLPQELALAGITDMAAANRFLKEVYLPAHNARFARPAEDTGSAFVAFAGNLAEILCVQADRVVGDNTVRYNGLSLQIPADRHRHHTSRPRSSCRTSRRHPRRLPRPALPGPDGTRSRPPKARPRDPPRPNSALWISGQLGCADRPLPPEATEAVNSYGT